MGVGHLTKLFDLIVVQEQIAFGHLGTFEGEQLMCTKECAYLLQDSLCRTVLY